MKGLSQTILNTAIGIILGIVGTYIVLVQRVTKTEDAIAVLERQPNPASLKPDTSTLHVLPPGVKPEKLNDVIRTEQKKYIRDSYGQEAYQCFTQDDLVSFVKNNRPLRIVAELRHNNDFLDIVVAIRTMAPGERQHLLDASRGLSHPTWSELGRISSQGQTDAGQHAEQLVAGAIVAEVERLIKLSDDEIKKLYT